MRWRAIPPCLLGVVLGACATASSTRVGDPVAVPSEVLAAARRPPMPPAEPLFPPAETPAARRVRAAWADSVLRTMSPRDRVAQLVWPWILGDYNPEGSREWARIVRLVTEERVGGFIVSVGGPTDIAAKVNALQRLSDLPLLISADLETGAGFRARGGYFLPNAIELGGATSFPLQMALGAAGDTVLGYELGRVTAVEARALGIHIAYGPVLDVNNNPANPVIGARSISEDPRLTAQMGRAVLKGLQDHGMLATGKHFPGHGDTETNSHLALATVNASRARLDSVELMPFREAIAAGIGGIMTFHGFLPALDRSDVPATLSPEVMTRLLRQELGFDGLLVTDAMDMRGVVDRFGAGEAVKRAVAAGNDVLLMPADVRGAIDAVIAGIGEGRYDQARIDRSVRRVLELKHRFGLPGQRLVSLDAVRGIVGDPANVASAQLLADRSFTLVRDASGLVPLEVRASRSRVLSVTFARRADLGAGVAFDAQLGERVDLRKAFVNADDARPNIDRVVEDAAQADVVVIGSYVNVTSESASADAPMPLVDLVNRLSDRGARVILVSFGSPYVIAQAPRAGAYAIAWGGTAASQRAAAHALVGAIPIGGRLPITIPGIAVLGTGETRPARP